MSISVLLVDRYGVVLDAFTEILHDCRDIEVVGQARSGAQAFTLAKEWQPNIFLVGEKLTDMEGAEMVEALRRVFPDVKAILMAESTDGEAALRAAQAGVCGYLLRHDDLATLVQRIKEVAEGRLAIPGELRNNLCKELAKFSRSKRDSLFDGIRELSERQKEILRYVCKGMPNAEIAKQVHLSETTVRGHVRVIMGKTDCANRTQLAAWAVREMLSQEQGKK